MSTSGAPDIVLTIEFLYLDVTRCGRCRGTAEQLDDVLPLIRPVLEATGFDVHVERIHVQSEEQAIALGLLVSPTIRVNGRDIQLNRRETPCDACSRGCSGEVSCREWEYRGRWYTVPPTELIISAIMREVYGRPEAGAPPVSRRRPEAPDNLKRFFARGSRS
ncbi:MAG TPA: DUF2703 domain-containing protein [Methylomirabilota bacterium]|jgi:hypothetical protein